MVKYKEIILKNDEGKYVTMKQTRDGWKLCVEDVQNAEVHSLTLWVLKEEKLDRNTFLAFVWKNANIFYSPKVNGDKLQLGELNCFDFTTCLSSGHWFKMTNPHHGDYCGLASAVNPDQHLSLSKNIEVQVSKDDTKWLVVMDKNP